MINGLIAEGFSPKQLRASDPSAEALENLRGLGLSQLSTVGDDLFEGVDLVVAAVKPQIMPTALASISSQLSAETALLSIAAGIPIESLQRSAGCDVPIIRCMPNTPAMIGLGMSGLIRVAFALALVAAQLVVLVPAGAAQAVSVQDQQRAAEAYDAATAAYVARDFGEAAALFETAHRLASRLVSPRHTTRTQCFSVRWRPSNAPPKHRANDDPPGEVRRARETSAEHQRKKKCRTSRATRSWSERTWTSFSTPRRRRSRRSSRPRSASSSAPSLSCASW